MSRKGKVQITVDGVQYRAAAEIRRGTVRLIVQRDGGGRRLEAAFDPFVLAGREADWHDYVAKGLIAVAIREATARGWDPTRAGPPYVLPEAALVGEHPRPAWVDGGRGRDLLDAVLAHPDAVEPRLVLADWLAERDDPRGELIRTQCAGDAAGELLRRYWRRWSAPAQRVAHRWTFWRGFVDHVAVQVPPDPGDWAALHAVEPVRTVAARVTPGRAAWLRHLLRASHRQVTLTGTLDVAGVQALAAAAEVARPALRLSCGLGDEALPALLDAEALAEVAVQLDASTRRGLAPSELAWVRERRPRWT